MIQAHIEKELQNKDILLMSHIVIGYPSIEASYKIVDQMVEAGVELIELQIPFSEPMADGPVILHANQEALKTGIKISDCIEFAKTVTEKYDIPFLFMTYYNILYKYGVSKFVGKMKACGIQGAIVPDVPPEEGKEYIDSMKEEDLSPIFIYSPKTSQDRMIELDKHGTGFMYCVARAGVTGKDTNFTEDLQTYLDLCKKSTNLPLALGFGVKEKKDVDFIRGKADIAVIGSRIIQLINEEGVDAVAGFVRSLR